ncbi:DUF4332 domain-containing protein [Pirellulaceae bacterium SH449]
MQLIVAVLRAAHCKSVHHYFALDALEEVRTESGRQLCRMLLAHFSDYLTGAKDPDTAFKDFQNHCLHVQDKFWGGAAKAAAKWYSESLEHLKAGRWRDAAYSIGVLSHYFTDPWMPLHTGQAPKESIVHRPMEWSICCAYDEILDLALSDPSLPSFELPETDNWLKDSIHSAALLSNRYYDALIDAYDMTEARVQPKVALDLSSRRMLAQLFTWAISGWAAIIDRLAFESPTKVPSFSLTWPTLLATVKVPVARITKTISDAQQKREVEAILQEYLSTGSVKRSLPEEQVTVSKARIRYPDLLPTQREIADACSIVKDMDARESGGVRTPPITKPTNAATTKQREESQPAARKTSDATISPPPPTLPQASHAAKRFKRLELDSPIVDAPAIGPKTAARLQAVGVTTVGQLLTADSEQLARLLKANWINAQTIDQWKGQARLSREIAGLSSAGSGLLFLSGVTTSEELLVRTVDEVHQMMVRVAKTAQGQRVLRDKPPPSRELINKWRQRAMER